jgi:hypothetical protein
MDDLLGTHRRSAKQQCPPRPTTGRPASRAFNAERGAVARVSRATTPTVERLTRHQVGHSSKENQLSTRKVVSVLAASAALVAALSVPALAGSEDLPAGPSSAPQSAAYNEPNAVSIPGLGDDDNDKSDDKDKSDKSDKRHHESDDKGDHGKPDDSRHASDDKGDHGKSDKEHYDKGDHGKSDKKPAPKPETVKGDLPVTH